MPTYSGTLTVSAARAGMLSLISELRGMCEAGTAEYNLVGSDGTVSYWGDIQLQQVLDLHRTDFIHQQLRAYPVVVAGGTLNYFDYRAPVGFFEQTSGGTSIFYIQDATGTALGTALWSADYRSGKITFVSDAKGTALYLTARAYDLHAAAADVWRKKAAHYAPRAVNFSTDIHRVDREQVYTHCLDMVKFFEGISGNSIQSVEMYRSDM